MKEFKDFKKFAAIDIGSNAIRLLISNIYIQKNKSIDFTKNSLVRVPVRLELGASVEEMVNMSAVAVVDAQKKSKLK